MSNKCSNNNGRIFDLEERTSVLGERIIGFVGKLGPTEENKIFRRQILRSGTSVGANYMEANGAATKKDFKNKIAICRKEAKETRYWLRMIKKANLGLTERCDMLMDEVQQLVFIFSKIITSCNKKKIEN